MPTKPKLSVVNILLLGNVQSYKCTFLQVQVWGLEPISADTG